MQLHQFLRFLKEDCFIVLFDLQGRAIVKADRKLAIPLDYYEDDILQITSMILPNSATPAVCIMLQK